MTKDGIFFHVGELWATGADGIPRQFATLQDIGFNFKADVKELFGQKQFSVDAATGTKSLTGKWTSGEYDPILYNALFFGETVSEGSLLLVPDEVGTVADAAITVSGAATFDRALSVKTTGGVALVQVGASDTPAAGEYKVSNGVYTFAAATADGTKFLISYTKTSVEGQTVSLSNRDAGDTVSFEGRFWKKSRSGKTFGMIAPSCIMSSLDLPFKQNDYLLPAAEFTITTPAVGSILQFVRGA
ncbi:MAG: hypothetical protein E2576_11020 [Alcaligenaceae bacterium]|nr:hypothetical protein [Alcaligenaceae bacterium SAGV5]MPS51261.1 hypothetical protein [Alcaligenaceae bacterium SAGV3]MPT57242.1 hypothetical protein [Alcaligenaceae bacterium]